MVNGIAETKTKYRYIYFQKVGILDKWLCFNTRSNAELGQVCWYAHWHQYCYFPTIQAVYSVGCLQDIQDFIKQLVRELPALPRKGVVQIS